MKILAFDISTDCLTAGIYQDGRTLAEHHEASSARHAEVFFGVLRRLLSKARLKPARLGAVAVGLGPGSFTGLRVGVTAAKVMAYSLGVRLIGIPTHEIIAMNAEDFDGVVAVVCDAKKGNVYASAYRPGSGGRVAIEPTRVCRAESFFKKMRKPFCLITDDWKRTQSRMPPRAADLVAGVLERELAFPRAAMIGRAARRRIRLGMFADPFKLEPLYLYPRDCNVVLKKKKLRQ